MEWLLHHWPMLWMLYEPAALRVLVAAALPVLLFTAPAPLFRRI